MQQPITTAAAFGVAVFAMLSAGADAFHNSGPSYSTPMQQTLASMEAKCEKGFTMGSPAPKPFEKREMWDARSLKE